MNLPGAWGMCVPMCACIYGGALELVSRVRMRASCVGACVGMGGGGWFVKVFLCGGRAGVSKHACWHVLGGSYLCLLFNTMLDFVDLAWDGIQVSSLLFLLI